MSRLSRLTHLFTTALKSRERPLPEGILQQYLDALLSRREVFLESALRFGTPQYFFDEPALSSRILRFKAAFSRHLESYRLFYAMKSNSFIGICRKAVEEGMGLDVSSGLELCTALAVDSKEIIFSGPGKTDEELLLALRNRSRVTLLMDSFGELQRLSEILKREPISMGDPLRVGVRIQHRGQWKKFGIPLKELGVMLKRSRAVEGIQLCGIQFHCSWNLDPTPQVKMIEEIGTCLRRKISPRLWQSLGFLDIGGGFWPEQGEWLNAKNTLKGRLIELLDPDADLGGRHYYRRATPIDDFAKEIARAHSRQPPPLCDLELWMEPGRWISTPTMHIILKVVDKKDRETVITDGGTNLLGWERPLTEFIPVIDVTRPSREEHRIMVFGSLCTPLDIWGTSAFGNGIDIGDTLVVPDQGAYTYSLRQSFIKPKARVIRYDGKGLHEAEEAEIAGKFHL